MSNEYYLVSDSKLYHWDVKGMKWGIRRYRNPDGTLTPAGLSGLREHLSENSTFTETNS